MHYVIPVRRTGQHRVRDSVVLHNAEAFTATHSRDFSITPKAVNFTDFLCFGELRRIPRPGTRDKSCLAPQVRVMAPRKMMPSDARPNFKTGCVWDKAPQERHPHSRLVAQMFCFINQKPKSSTNHQGRTHECIYQTFVFLAAVGVYSLRLLWMKVKGTLHNFSFSHVWTSLCSQQGQIYFGTLNGNNVDSVSQ